MENDENKDEKDTGATSDELGDAGKRALEAERKARRAAEARAKEAETKVKEAEDADKTVVEKLQGQVADLTKNAEAAKATADRWEVAIDKGLTKAQARRLVGATKEELEADADAMAEELGLKKDEEPAEDDTPADDEDTPPDERPLGRPKEILHSGEANAEDETPDAGALAAEILSKPY